MTRAAGTVAVVVALAIAAAPVAAQPASSVPAGAAAAVPAELVSIARLADPVLPEPVAWLPQTLGWQILAGLLVLGVLWLVWRAARRWWRNRYRRDALAEWRQLEARWQREPDNAAAVLTALPVLVKRCALSAWPREQVASLSGAAWAQFLEVHAGHATHGAQALAPLVREMQYQDQQQLARVPAHDVRVLLDASRQWIEGHVSA